MSEKYIISENALSAIETLNSAGFEAYIVGGAVRDLVMGIKPHDFDIATSALPSETEKVFDGFKLIETGMKHGTVTVLIDGEPLEITTFRIDGNYTDMRRPDSVSFNDDYKNDLSRRDFTCNALAYHPQKGIIDYFDGVADIRNRIIKCVGEPDKRFGEDALRIMRALRFSSVLGFEIDKETSDSIHRNRGLLNNISKERIFTELCKLLEGNDVYRVLDDYSDIVFTIMPELEPMYKIDQQNPAHRYDVWHHSLHAVENIRPDAELRLAMLLHDSGKPSVKTVDENGIGHFYGHAEYSVEIARRILGYMKTSNRLLKHVCDLVEYHGIMPEKMSARTFRKYIGLLGEATIKELFEVREADVRALDSFLTEKFLSENENAKEFFREITENEKCFCLKDLAVNGNDLIEIGFSEDSSLGKALSSLLDEVMDNKLDNEKNALLKRAKEFLDDNRNG